MATAAETYMQQGDPDAALRALQEEIRKKPADAALRVFLFQLLAIQGNWERALNQLNVAGELDASYLLMVQAYRAAIQCERLRHRVFAGQTTPLLFGEPAQWVALLLEALRLTANGNAGEAQALREEAFDSAPASAGNVDGTAVAWLADADSRLGPVLEAILDGRYYWIPLQHIGAIEMEAPAALRDLIWMPARFTWRNGGQAHGLIPTRYPGSETEADAALRLARRTEWREPSPGCYLGLGQRILAGDTGEFPLMDVRTLRLEPV